MSFSPADWAIVAAYFALTAVVGFLFTRRGGSSTSEYFLSGRKAPWWLLGTSMVATTFAADTPLAVCGLVATRGVAGNWLWWNAVMSGVLTVFFFARLWRRAGVTTDVELAEVRYGGRPAAVLRGFRAVYLGVPINLLVLGWVTKAMVKILTLSLDIDPWLALVLCMLVTVAYVGAAGLWAVLWTDFFQFALMMSAVVALAVFAADAVGGMAALQAKVAAHFGGQEAALSVLPVTFEGGSLHGWAWMPLTTLGVYLGVQWWAAWYPGQEPGGGGYVAQRIFAARTERDGMLATLLFQVGHYAVRPWPWIVTGLATVVLYPDATDKEGAYVRAFLDLMPTPWRGVMLAGFAAAYMSTIATQLNWGASYLVNDLYRRFLRKDASEKHYVNASRLATVLLFLGSIAVTWNIDSIGRTWELLLALGAGTGLVLILRWYWWRINAWSEISAMAASLVVSVLATWLVKPRFPEGDPNGTSLVFVLTVGISTLVWLAATFATAPEKPEVLEAFYRRVRPGGPGWAKVSEKLGLGREAVPGGALSWANWGAGVVAVYATLFGVGRIVFGRLGAGVAILALAAACFAFLSRSLRREGGTEVAGKSAGG